jgi:class 3 adenylate cyclase/1-acyl-sn-glycerol-3-phosphate acyltransferase
MKSVPLSASATQESWARRLRRRLVTVPAIGLAFVVVSALFPLLLAGALIVDRLRPQGDAPRSFVTRRLVREAWAFLAIECVGLVMLAWAGATTIFSAEKRQRRTFAVQRIYTGLQWRAAAALFDLTLVIENPEALVGGDGDAPVVVFLRHASLVDVLLPAVLLANRPEQPIALRYVLKRELLVEPCIDIAGNWLPNCFVSRDGTDSPKEIARVRALKRGLGRGEGVLVYPEGTRFTAGKRRRILERLQGDESARQIAESLRHLLPVRAGGCLALLDEAPACDVLFVGHEGLEGFATLSDIWRRQMVGRTVRVKVWREAAATIPTDDAARLVWLTERWQRLDDWLHQVRLRTRSRRQKRRARRRAILRARPHAIVRAAPMTKREALSREQMLALYPWPEDLRNQARLDWFWTFEVAAEVDELWPIIADTSRMNRALGVSEMTFEDHEGARWGTSRPGGLLHRWVEEPWSWVAGQWLTSLRRYERGFSKAVYAAFHLEPLPTEQGGGTRLYAYFGSIPRGFFSSWILRLGFPPLEKAYRTLLPRIAAEIHEARSFSVPKALLRAGVRLPDEVETRVARIKQSLLDKRLDQQALDLFFDWVRKGDEADLYRIQIRERARAWGLDEDALLRVALHATREGLLELSWDLVCPHCRGVTQEVGKLGVLPASGACEVCRIDFGTEGLDAVEITFHVHPSIRDIAHRSFCSAEPATKDHIRIQKTVKKGETVTFEPRLSPGRYRARLLGEKQYGYLEVKEAAPDDPLVWERSFGEQALEKTLSPRAALSFVNTLAEDTIFIVERVSWTDTALRPGRLLSFQEFRDLFGEEYLSADVQLAVGEQTILFTDMVGSTAMYRERGDPAAFMEVKRHFTRVFAIVAKHRGAVVKTIGDAAMGAFNSPLDAVKASKEIHDTFHGLRGESLARLRISLNTGPCIAVRLNTEIDYFGHTVNVAAKLQALAETWQIAMSESTFDAPGVAQWLHEEGAVLDDLAYSSAAIPEPIRVKRWTLHEVEEPSAKKKVT